MGAYLPLPYVYEREGRQERAWDIYSRLLRDRIVFIGTPIDDYVANSIIAQLLFLQMEDPKKEIHVYINSPGGSVSDGMAIYDTLNFLQCDIVTYCIGMAASMSTVLLAAGTPGKRFCPPEQPCNDSPTKRWSRRTNLRYLHCCQGNSPMETNHQRDPRQA